MDPSEVPAFAPEILSPREIRELRLKCHLTQQGLARKLNVSRETIVRWERGRQVPNPVYLELLRKIEKEATEPQESPAGDSSSVDKTTLPDSRLLGTCPICGQGSLRLLPVRYAVPAAQQEAEGAGGILAYQCVNEHVFFVMAKDVMGD